jgi:hypothetical protein
MILGCNAVVYEFWKAITVSNLVYISQKISDNFFFFKNKLDSHNCQTCQNYNFRKKTLAIYAKQLIMKKDTP